MREAVSAVETVWRRLQGPCLEAGRELTIWAAVWGRIKVRNLW